MLTAKLLEVTTHSEAREKELQTTEKKLQAREKELQAREKELQAREKELQAREKELQAREKAREETRVFETKAKEETEIRSRELTLRELSSERDRLVVERVRDREENDRQRDSWARELLELRREMAVFRENDATQKRLLVTAEVKEREANEKYLREKEKSANLRLKQTDKLSEIFPGKTNYHPPGEDVTKKREYKYRRTQGTPNDGRRHDMLSTTTPPSPEPTGTHMAPADRTTSPTTTTTTSLTSTITTTSNSAMLTSNTTRCAATRHRTGRRDATTVDKHVTSSSFLQPGAKHSTQPPAGARRKPEDRGRHLLSNSGVVEVNDGGRLHTSDLQDDPPAKPANLQAINSAPLVAPADSQSGDGSNTTAPMSAPPSTKVGTHEKATRSPANEPVPNAGAVCNANCTNCPKIGVVASPRAQSTSNVGSRSRSRATRRRSRDSKIDSPRVDTPSTLANAVPSARAVRNHPIAITSNRTLSHPSPAQSSAQELRVKHRVGLGAANTLPLQTLSDPECVEATTWRVNHLKQPDCASVRHIRIVVAGDSAGSLSPNPAGASANVAGKEQAEREVLAGTDAETSRLPTREEEELAESLLRVRDRRLRMYG